MVQADAGALDDADDAEEEVDGREAGHCTWLAWLTTKTHKGLRRRAGQGKDAQIVLGLDNQAPPGPDDAGSGQGGVLGQRELLGGAAKVGDAGDDETPFHDGGPTQLTRSVSMQSSQQQNTPSRSSLWRAHPHSCNNSTNTREEETTATCPPAHIPEMHRLQPDRAVPHALGPRLGGRALGGCALEAPGAGLVVAEEEVAGAEGRPGRAEEVACGRHGGCL